MPESSGVDMTGNTDQGRAGKRTSGQHPDGRGNEWNCTHSSLIEYGLPICALKERSRQNEMIHVRSLFRTSRSRARPSGVSGLTLVDRRCKFKSVAILQD